MTGLNVATSEDISDQASRAAPPGPRLTEDDLARFPEDDILRELVDGELREWLAPGPEHGAIETDLAAELRQFVKDRRLGHVMSGEVHFRIRGTSTTFDWPTWPLSSPPSIPMDGRPASPMGRNRTSLRSSSHRMTRRGWCRRKCATG